MTCGVRNHLRCASYRTTNHESVGTLVHRTNTCNLFIYFVQTRLQVPSKRLIHLGGVFLLLLLDHLLLFLHRFEVLDVVAEPLPTGFDVVLCSLFLHHMDDRRATQLLAKMRQAARRIVLVSDLVRSARGQTLAYLASRLLTTSDVVRVDAPRSVRAAFTPSELKNLARRAQLDGAGSFTAGRCACC